MTPDDLSRLTSLFGVLTLFVACGPEKPAETAVPIRLVAKYQTLDEHISPQHAKCPGRINSFLTADPYDCSFTVQGLEFDIERKYVLDADGHLKARWVYLAEGPVISSIEELRRDTAGMRYDGLNDFHIGLLAGAAIVDGNDTLPIERRFPQEKLLLAKRTAHLTAGRRLIYQYQ